MSKPETERILMNLEDAIGKINGNFTEYTIRLKKNGNEIEGQIKSIVAKNNEVTVSLKTYKERRNGSKFLMLPTIIYFIGDAWCRVFCEKKIYAKVRGGSIKTEEENQRFKVTFLTTEKEEVSIFREDDS